MAKTRKTFIVLAVMLIFGAVLGLTLIKPAIDSENIQPPWDTTYKPTLYTTFTLCKAGTGTSPRWVSAITDDKTGTIFGLWFGSEVKVRMRVTGPDMKVNDYDSPLIEVDWASCPGVITLPQLNPTVSTGIQWKAWAGAGTYSIQFKMLKSNGEEYYPGEVKTGTVVIGDSLGNTNYPQTHSI